MKIKKSLAAAILACSVFTITSFADTGAGVLGQGIFRYGERYPITQAEADTLGEVEQAVSQFKADYIRDDMSLFEKEMTIIDYLMVHVDYDDTLAAKSYWAYSALIEGKAVCDGYTKAFMELADACGIETKKVAGTVALGPHAWNLVKLDDGEWYHVDVTFADTGGFYGHYNYDRSKMKSADAHCTAIEGLGELWLNCVNYPDGLITLDHWDIDEHPAANGYLYGPKVADEYFMNGIIDLSLAKTYEEIAQVMENNDNAHNKRSKEILADFDYVIPFTTWDETMETAQSYLRSASNENLRLAVKYENWDVYSKSKGDHSFIFAYELIKDPGQYGFSPYKAGEWYLSERQVNYEPFDEKNPVYDIFYSYIAGESDPYRYDE